MNSDTSWMTKRINNNTLTKIVYININILIKYYTHFFIILQYSIRKKLTIIRLLKWKEDMV